MSPKIFGVGLHKTGTSTLGESLRILGYHVCPEDEAYPTQEAAIAGDYRACLSLAEKYEGFEDSPWNYTKACRLLDEAFPQSLFILTVRDRGRWFESLLRWVTIHGWGGDRNLIYILGDPVTAESRDRAMAAYAAHNDAIVEYFSTHGKDRLLVADWEAGDRWQRLCTFLAKPVPQNPFPHIKKYNPAENNYINTVSAQEQDSGPP